MENKRVSIVLDQAIVDQLALSKGQQLKAELYENKLVLQKDEPPKQGRLASWVLIAATVLLCILFYAVSSIEKRIRFYWLVIILSSLSWSVLVAFWG